MKIIERNEIKVLNYIHFQLMETEFHNYIYSNASPDDDMQKAAIVRYISQRLPEIPVGTVADVVDMFEWEIGFYNDGGMWVEYFEKFDIFAKEK